MTRDNRCENIDQPLFEDRRARFRFSCAGFLPHETEQTIHQRFEKQVTKYGNGVAVKTKDVEWTYEDLNRRANRVSRAISASCSAGTDQVALLFGHDAAAVCAMIGVLKSGKVCVPIVASNPSIRIRSMIEDARANLIVTHNQTIEQARALAGSTIRIMNIDEIGSTVSDEDPHNSVRPDSCACILYTSGSMGQPKGVLQTHRNILHQVYSYTNKIGITASDRLSLLPSFDVGAGHLDIYAALLNGASLYPCNIKEEGIQQLTEWLIRERITVYHSVPTLFRHITSYLEEGTLFAGVRVVTLGGEHVSLRDVELFRKHFSGNSILVNSLACTEAGPFAQYFADHDSEFNEGRVPAGYPTEDMEILLRDNQGNLVCGDGVGEILIKSRYLSPGYWQSPELTDVAFKADSDEQRLRTYCTGDLGRIRPDGMLEHLGRKDSLVKIRGYRVEIPEIELALQTHPIIRDAAVVGHGDSTEKKYLTAYVVLNQGEHILATSLRAYLNKLLPDYMIPSTFVFLESLPMTPNGKLDRNALRAVQPEEMRQEGICMVPEDPVEQKLTEVWCHLLRMKHIRVNDNFFDLGGDSLAAIDLFCWIEKEYGKRLSPSAIYEWPTIKQLAALITETPKPEQGSCIIPIKMKGSGPPLFVIPNILGNSLYYSELLKYLDRDQIVYAVEMSEKDLEKPINDAATYCVDQIRKSFPVGPYSLIGYSSGGIMALEMARRFGELNCNVPFLAMIDTIFPSSSESQLPRSGKVVSPLFLKNLPYWLYYFLPYWMSYYVRLARSENFRSYDKETQNRILAVRSWLKHYRPEPYPGRVVFYRAKAQGLFTASSHKNWENICGALDVDTVPGCHNTMMNKPHVRYLAEKIDSALRKSISLLPDVCGKVKTELIF